MYTLLALFVMHALWFDSLLLTNPEAAPLPRSERSGYLEEWTAGTGIKEVSEYILAEHAKNPNQSIVVGTEGYFGTLPDALQAYLQNVPNVTVIGIGLGIKEVPVQLQEAVAAGSQAYLVANSSRLLFPKDFSEYGLEIVGQYKKADRPDNTKEFVQDGLFDYLYLLKVN